MFSFAIKATSMTMTNY